VTPSHPTALPGVPLGLRWLGTPVDATLDGDVLRMTAGPRTDRFVDPEGLAGVVSAPALVGPLGTAGTAGADGDFQLSARATVELASTFDAAVLLVWIDEQTFAKLCFELSPQGTPMIVTVVTRGLSDDADAFTVDGDAVWLRVGRRGATLAFHASTDGRRWDMVRYFALPTDAERTWGSPSSAPPGSAAWQASPTSRTSLNGSARCATGADRAARSDPNACRRCTPGRAGPEGDGRDQGDRGTTHTPPAGRRVIRGSSRRRRPAGSRRHRDAITARAMVPSVHAKASPMHCRLPAPKGK
jgi:regulation of enolase protein 1 (concanavalin A-like superfamily)